MFYSKISASLLTPNYHLIYADQRNTEWDVDSVVVWTKGDEAR